MTLNWTTTDKEGVGHGIKALAYGEAGSGKTHLCGTAPKPVIISAEKGMLTLRKLEGIPVLVVSNIQDVYEAYDWCRDHAVANGIQTVCLDSISEITEKCLAAAKAKTKDPRQAYGEMASDIIDLVKQFRDLPGLHVLITAKERQIIDPITNVQKAAPSAPGQIVGPALPYLFDLVMHAYTMEKDADGNTPHVLGTHASFNAQAKDRSGVLDEVEFACFTNIVNKIISS